MERFDIAIIGGGPAGAVAARSLALRGCRVVLFERRGFEAIRAGESLAPGIQPILRELGLWDSFLDLRPLPSYGTRSVWGSDEVVTHSHMTSPYGSGWHVERRAFDRMLLEEALSAGAELREGVLPTGFTPTERGAWELLPAGTSGPSIRADFLIDATGRSAHVARAMGARRLSLDRLVGIGAVVSGIDAEHGFLQIEATSEGWWYSAPLGPDRMMVMLMTDADLCAAARSNRPEVWDAKLAATLHTAARARGRRIWGPLVFPATSHCLVDEPTGPWAAVGDAAMSVDPVSGSGVIRALRSAARVSEACIRRLARARAEPNVGADLPDWQTYLRERLLYYGMERRWPLAPFWSRRRGGPTGAVAVGESATVAHLGASA